MSYSGIAVEQAYDKRKNDLAEHLRSESVDAYFAGSPASMKYLQGFGEDGHERLLVLAVNRDGEVAMICPQLSEEQARRAGIENIYSYPDHEDPVALVERLSNEWGLAGGTVAIDNELRASSVFALKDGMGDTELILGHRILSIVRRKKSSDEVDALFEASRLTDEAYLEVLEKVEIGMSETEVAELAESALRSRGLLVGFCIVAAGKGSGEPHHLNSYYRLASGDVVTLDFGGSIRGYQSDLTRCFSMGEPEAEADKVYDVVYRAHMAAREAIRPGALAGDVDKAARDVIESERYGEFFVHRTGHGIGMLGHEDPNIVGGSTTRLQEWDCFTIEPGVYLPGRFGVRIENVIVCTSEGHRSLNSDPPARLPRI